MKKLICTVVAAAALAALSACSTTPKAPAAPAMAKDGVLVSLAGLTLYTFDSDSAGKSACNAKCPANWPPLLVNSEIKPSGDWTTFERDDGLVQWAYKGKAVYTYVKDTKPGDKTGDGLNGLWHIAKP